MKFLLESEDIADYLEPIDNLVDFDHPLIRSKINAIEKETTTFEERARLAFHFVRDEVRHSFDLTDSVMVTISAADVMEKGEGICFAKSHLLAALLRGMGIPTGFCYQRVTRKGTKESGYALHGLNAVYLPDGKRWFRLDPRGNKEGVFSEFSIESEKLAYPIRQELDEIDYPHILIRPLDTVVTSMKGAADSRELFSCRPEELSV